MAFAGGCFVVEFFGGKLTLSHLGCASQKRDSVALWCLKIIDDAHADAGSIFIRCIPSVIFYAVGRIDYEFQADDEVGENGGRWR